MYDDNEAQILDFHRSMVVDSARMRAYARAVMAAVKPGDVVLDLGCGTGVLSFLACVAGASRVYAVEQSAVISLAEELSRRNGFDDRIVFLNDWSAGVELPEQVDVLLTETIGNAAIDEGIVGWMMDARLRLLRPGGAVVPETLRLWTAAVESWDDHALVADWCSGPLTFDFTAAHERARDTLWWVDLPAKSVLTDPALVSTLDLREAEDRTIDASGVLSSKRKGTVHGLACWFDAELVSGITVSNKPPAEAPSWSQAFLPAAQPFRVTAEETLSWKVSASANGGAWQWDVTPAANARDHVANVIADDRRSTNNS